MPLKGQLKRKAPAMLNKKASAEVKQTSTKASAGSKRKSKPAPISSESSSDSEEIQMRSVSESDGEASGEYQTSRKVALFDSDEDAGSGNEMDVDEAPLTSKASSKASSSVLSKYAKKSSGFSDSNSEWLKLKQEAKKQAKRIVKGDSSEEDSESDSTPAEDEFDDLNPAEFEEGSSSEDEEDNGPAYEAMERKTRKLEEKKKKMRSDAALEEQEQIERAKEDGKGHGFEFPTPEIMVKEKELGVDMNIIKARFEETLRVLSNFKDARDGEHTRKDYMQLLINDLAFFYGYNNFLVAKFLSIFSPSECAEFIQANEAHRPLTIRVNTLKTRRGDLLRALIGRGVNLEAISWSKVAIQVFESSVPIGATPEYLAGHYMLQSASSMTSVVALNPQPDERILDMCAAPGGKTTYIAQCMKNTGTLVANDVHPDRLKSLTANLHRLGVRNAIVTNYDGKEFPTVMGGFDRVLLDAPCTGTGVIARDASVKVSKSQEDILKLGQVQRRLILAAIDSIDANSPTGGILVYATCSITVEENEAIIDFALRKRYIKVIDSGMEFGKPGIVTWRHYHFNDQVKLARRYYPHVYNMDGFFICKIKKLKNGVREQQDKKRKRGDMESGSDDDGNNTRRRRGDKKQEDDEESFEEQPEFEEVSDDEESSDDAPTHSNGQDSGDSDDLSEPEASDSDDEATAAPPKKRAKLTAQSPSSKQASKGANGSSKHISKDSDKSPSQGATSGKKIQIQERKSTSPGKPRQFKPKSLNNFSHKKGKK